jgi:hypothetical protein
LDCLMNGSAMSDSYSCSFLFSSWPSVLGFGGDRWEGDAALFSDAGEVERDASRDTSPVPWRKEHGKSVLRLLTPSAPT